MNVSEYVCALREAGESYRRHKASFEAFLGHVRGFIEEPGKGFSIHSLALLDGRAGELHFEFTGNTYSLAHDYPAGQAKPVASTITLFRHDRIGEGEPKKVGSLELRRNGDVALEDKHGPADDKAVVIALLCHLLGY